MKNIIEILKDVVFTITHPATWYMEYPYDKHYDRWILKIINCDIPIKQGEYTTHILFFYKTATIWTSNFPYSYGNLYDPEIKVRPSRRTIYKLRDDIHKKTFNLGK